MKSKNIIIIIIIYILFLAIVLGNCKNKNEIKMNRTYKHTIKSKGVIILEYELKDKKLHGNCNWYSLKGVMLSSGEFKNGKPFTGSFLNWSKVINNIFKEDVYEIESYCKDWVTFYESGFDSALPKYITFLEFYNEGKKEE